MSVHHSKVSDIFLPHKQNQQLSLVRNKMYKLIFTHCSCTKPTIHLSICYLTEFKFEDTSALRRALSQVLKHSESNQTYGFVNSSLKTKWFIQTNHEVIMGLTLLVILMINSQESREYLPITEFVCFSYIMALCHPAYFALDWDFTKRTLNFPATYFSHLKI